MLRHYHLEVINIFEQGVPHVHFAPGSPSHVWDPVKAAVVVGKSLFLPSLHPLAPAHSFLAFPTRPSESCEASWEAQRGGRRQAAAASSWAVSHSVCTPRGDVSGVLEPLHPPWRGEDPGPLLALFCFPFLSKAASCLGFLGLTEILVAKCFYCCFPQAMGVGLREHTDPWVTAEGAEAGPPAHVQTGKDHSPPSRLL